MSRLGFITPFIFLLISYPLKHFEQGSPRAPCSCHVSGKLFALFSDVAVFHPSPPPVILLQSLNTVGRRPGNNSTVFCYNKTSSTHGQNLPRERSSSPCGKWRLIFHIRELSSFSWCLRKPRFSFSWKALEGPALPTPILPPVSFRREHAYLAGENAFFQTFPDVLELDITLFYCNVSSSYRFLLQKAFMDS